MSGYPSGAGEGESAGGMNALLAQLRGQSKPINLEPSFGYYNTSNSFFGQPAQQHPQQPYGYQQPSISSPIPTPPIYNNPPHHSSAIMSPVDTPQPQQQQSQNSPAMGGPSNANRTSSLLGLLKFQQPSPNSPKQPAPIGTPLQPLPLSREPSLTFPASEAVSHVGPPSHARSGSGHGSDLLATLMGNLTSKSTQQASPQFATSQPAQSSFSAVSPSADTQAFLLQLLNQPKPPQSETTPKLKPAKVLTPPSKASSQNDVSELTHALEEASLEMNLMGSAATEEILEKKFGKENVGRKENVRAETPKTQGLFTYVNPFEQLAASSPRVRTPKNPSPIPPTSASPAIQILKRQNESTDNKRKLDARSNISSPGQHSKRKLGGPAAASSDPPTPKVEADIGTSGNKETVAEALSEVGDQVDRQVQEAIARAENETNDTQAVLEKSLEEMLLSKTEEEFEENAQVTAKSIKKELEKEENSHALDNLPSPVAELVKDIVDDAAQGHIADSWESADAEDSPVKEEEENAVKVYNFPMKPWTSITIKGIEEPRPTFRPEAILDIARLKKEFDQIDRTLVTASNSFIVYGMSKHGGVRIIGQDSGKDDKLFEGTRDRIFSVVISTSIPDMKEAILGTGISGTVYWALVKDGQNSQSEEDDTALHSEGFALPPIQTPDNDSPGGILKTRARKSSNHPEFFAVGRGKAIHIILPSVILKSCLKNGKERLVDTDKYLAHYSLKVNTGKAGKDFIFSEDDSTIVSLDKAGRVKFWDVRGLTKVDDRGRPAPESKQMEIRDPLVTLTTTPATEKSWPTSVLLVDKLRPYQRGGALRYLIVGMKQNHSLQLWDLALAKPVQEIHLPHSKESDAVCSVLYHAATGMIVVGHPTRNSIYFLHLSAPKYNLPKSVTQAEYMQKLVANDPSIAKPDSTAVISGMREYSFENKGSLRSLDILQTPSPSTLANEPSTLFELYAMHSKGVTCINIKQAELGWTQDHKVINAVSAEKEEVISIDNLKEIPVASEPVESAPSFPTRIVPRPAKEAAPKDTSKKAHHAHPEPSTSASASKVEEKAREVSSNGTSNSGAEKSRKPRHPRTGRSSASVPASHETSSSNSTVPQATPTNSISAGSSRNGSASKTISTDTPEAITGPSPALALSNVTLKDAETRISEDVKKLLTDSLDSLYLEIKSDRRTQSVVAQTNQEQLLRMVSSTLADNVDASLEKVISKNIEKDVLPAISTVTLAAVNEQLREQLGSKLTSNLGSSIPKELQRALPDAITRALQQPQLLKLMSESLAKSVAFKVEDHFNTVLQKTVFPSFQNLAVQTAQRVAGDVQRQAAEQIGNLERQRNADSSKIDQLTSLVTGLTHTVSTMAASQQDFQTQVLRLQQQAASDRRESNRHSQSTNALSAASSAPVEDEQTERAKRYQADYNGVVQHMNEANFSSGVLSWLQSSDFQQEIFETYFSKYNPEFIRDMNSVVLLSIGSVISENLDDKLMLQRISWLEMVILSLQAQLNAGTAEEGLPHIPKIVGTWIQRLEALFLRITAINAHDPHLKQIQNLVSACKRVIESQAVVVNSPSNYLAGSMATNPGRRY